MQHARQAHTCTQSKHLFLMIVLYLQKCPSCRQKGQEALKDVSYCKMKGSKQNDKSGHTPYKQEQLKKSEHQLEICAKFFSTLGEVIEQRY